MKRVLVIALVVLGASGCTSRPGPPTPPPSAAAPPAAGQPPATATTGPSPEALDGPAPASIPSATWDAPAQGAAITRAEGFMRAFTRTDLPAAQWWAGVTGFLTPQAASDFQGTDPAQISAGHLTGPGAILTQTAGVVAVVDLPTGAGTYQVTMTRTGADQPWLVSLVTAPQGAR